jgi:thioredoxin-like negative regulator of GroEL
MTDRRDREGLLVACLCASWCTTCGEFRDTFDKLEKETADAKFVWLDIEADSALMGGLDVESFPTLAVFRGTKPLFYGVTMPQEGVVARTLASLSRDDREAVAVPEEIAALPAALNRP